MDRWEQQEGGLLAVVKEGGRRWAGEKAAVLPHTYIYVLQSDRPTISTTPHYTGPNHTTTICMFMCEAVGVLVAFIVSCCGELAVAELVEGALAARGWLFHVDQFIFYRTERHISHASYIHSILS